MKDNAADWGLFCHFFLIFMAVIRGFFVILQVIRISFIHDVIT